MIAIIKSLKNKKKIGKKTLDKMLYQLPKALYQKLIIYNNGSTRLDIDHLIRKLEKRQIGGDNSACKNEVIYGRNIGKGAFGEVHLFSYTTNGASVNFCVKYVKDPKIYHNILKLYNSNFLDFFEYTSFLPKGSDCLAYFQDHNINFFDIIVNRTDLQNYEIFYFLKYYKHGDLTKYKCRDIDVLFKNIIRGFKALDMITSKNFVHGDIKLDNILIDDTNHWVLHDFDYCSEIEPNDFKYDTFTPYYISPFLLCTARAINAKQLPQIPGIDYLSTYITIHNIVAPGASSNSFNNMMHFGTSYHKDDQSDYQNYKNIVKSYFEYNIDTTKDINYGEIIDLIKPDIVLTKLNILKNDYYAYGVILYYVYYNLIKKLGNFEDPKEQEEVIFFAENIVQPMLFLCIIPFYTKTAKIPKDFKHGEFILYCIHEFIKSDKSDKSEIKLKFLASLAVDDNAENKYQSLYKSMFDTMQGGAPKNGKIKVTSPMKGGAPKHKKIEVSPESKKIDPEIVLDNIDTQMPKNKLFDLGKLITEFENIAGNQQRKKEATVNKTK